MKTTATILAITICLLDVAMSAEKAFMPRFSDAPSVEATRLHLNAVGVESFFAEVQKANVAPPSIHSKYWVDTLPAKAAEERKREGVNRDFGLTAFPSGTYFFLRQNFVQYAVFQTNVVQTIIIGLAEQLCLAYFSTTIIPLSF